MRTPITSPLPASAAPVRMSHDRSGSAAAEFALVLTPLLLFLLGIVEMGRLMWTANALHYSVEEAARCASNNTATCGTASQIQSFAAGHSGEGFAAAVFTATTPSCGNLVSASYPMPLNIPFGTYSITLTAQSCYPK